MVSRAKAALRRFHGALGGLFLAALGARRSAPVASMYSDMLGPLVGHQRFADLPPPGKARGGRLEHEYGAEPRDDPSVQRLVANVDPAMRANPQPQPCYDLVVLGAGVAGLISCIVGRQMGRKIAMVEQHYMGGDCLNTGCVPSKALIAAAQAAHRVRDASRFGVTLRPEDVTVDFEAVMSRMRQIRAEISEHDSVHRYTVDVGVDVFSGRARFTDSNALVLSGGEKLRFRKCILGTGATAKVPPGESCASCSSAFITMSRIGANISTQHFYWTLSERALLIAGELYLPWHQTVQETSEGELHFGLRRGVVNRSPLPA
eukprot:s1683_g17.t1